MTNAISPVHVISLQAQDADPVITPGESPSEVFAEVIDAEMHGEPEGLFYSADLYVAVSLFLFFALLVYMKVPQKISKALDSRAEKISQQLEEARALREEAQGLLAQYQRQQRNAEAHAQEIVTQAETDAKRVADDAAAALDAFITRREQQAQEKIAQAEASAVQEVQTVAVDVATAVARKLIAEGLNKDQAETLIETSIKDLPKHLH